MKHHHRHKGEISVAPGTHTIGIHTRQRARNLELACEPDYHCGGSCCDITEVKISHNLFSFKVTTNTTAKVLYKYN